MLKYSIIYEYSCQLLSPQNFNFMKIYTNFNYYDIIITICMGGQVVQVSENNQKTMSLAEYCINTVIFLIVVALSFCLVFSDAIAEQKESTQQAEYLESLYEIGELTLDNYSEIISIKVTSETSADSNVTINPQKILAISSKCHIEDLKIEYSYNYGSGSNSAIETFEKDSFPEAYSTYICIEYTPLSLSIVGVTVESISGRVSK